MLAVLAALVMPAGSPLLVVDGMPIGTFNGKNWRAVNENKPELPDLEFHEIGFKSSNRAFPLKDLVFSEGTGVWAVMVDNPEQYGGAYLCGAKPNWPRTVQAIPLDTPVYVKQVKAFLTKNGMGYVKPRMTRISQVDLDGDGSMEVLIESSSRNQPAVVDITKNDYSLVLLNHMVKGKVKTELVEFDGNPMKNGMTNYNSVRGIADLDGDGNMEFVTTSAYYEGSSGSLWRWKGGKLTRMVENFAGV